jgi:hypothetical protein
MIGPVPGGTPLEISPSVGAPRRPAHGERMTRRRLPRPSSVYSEEDAAVSRPVAIRQELPPWPGSRSQEFQTTSLVEDRRFRLPSRSSGVLQVVIGENGLVESAVMIVSIRPIDDRRITAIAKGWRYRPALKEGQPVRYKKSVLVLFR